MSKEFHNGPRSFSTKDTQSCVASTKKSTERLKRLDTDHKLHAKLIPYCRLKSGDVWEDPIRGHRVGVLDATNPDHVTKIMGGEKASVVVNDPPYNIIVGNMKSERLSRMKIDDYLQFSRAWIKNAYTAMEDNAHLYIWLGADIRDNFQPLADFMIMMREFRDLRARNFITMRNQRGYGTQKNWMWTRQELLYFVKGNPSFQVVYTDIPKVLRGYHKPINGRLTENLERGKSGNIRPGNVWFDIQQVFYRMEENVPGCYAQKPLKSIERILLSSNSGGGLIADFFSHSGTTLIAGERLSRKVITFDIDPIYAEITIRRLEHYRSTEKTGWQWNNAFPELDD